MRDRDQQTTCRVRDGKRLITFDGDLLGDISSRRPGEPRWTEMSIYKTVGSATTPPQYVLEKVGRSIVTHMPDCPRRKAEGLKDRQLPRFQDVYPGEDPDVGFWYCECVDPEYDFTKLLVEEDRFWATIAEEPRRIVDAMYRRKDGSRHLPRISLDLLDEISKIDEGIAEAYLVERIS